MRTRKRLPRSLALLFWLCLVGKLWAQAPSESTVKVAYIYNFLKYVKWHGDEDISEFVIGVYGGDDVLYAQLSGMLAGKSIRGRGIQALHIDELERAKEVHLLVLASSQNDHIASIANTLRGSNTLLLTV